MIMLLDLLYYTGSLLAIIGTILNIKKDKNGFILWILADLIFIYQSYNLKAYNLVIICLIHIIVASIGYLKWKKRLEN